VSRRPFGTYWAAQWHSVNRLDGDRTHIIHVNLYPAFFQTRQEARDFIETNFGYIRDRPDLQAEPHGWKMPKPILVVVQPATADRR
jgi:hypothetical protein